MEAQPNGATSADDINAMFSTDRDRGADTAAPAERPQEPPKQETPHQAPPAEQHQQPVSEQNGSSEQRHVPLSELLAERKKRQETERLTHEMQGRLSAYEQQMQQLLARQHQPAHAQPQPQQPQPPPDPVTDPQGHAHWVQSQIQQGVAYAQQEAQRQFFNMSMAHAAERHGYENVRAAEQYAQQTGVLGQFRNYPDPYGTLMQWYGQQQMLSTIGGDFNAYQERLRREGAERALADLKKGNGNGQPQQQPRYPTTLADQTAAGAQTGSAPQSGSAMINAMFSPDRNRKAF